METGPVQTWKQGRYRGGNFNHPHAASFTKYRDHVLKSEVWGYAYTGGIGLYMHAVAVRMSERRWRGLYMHTEAVCMSDRRWRGLYMHLVKRFAHSGVNTD